MANKFNKIEEIYLIDKCISKLNETSESYDIFKIGDIVFVKDYVYKDGKKGKDHLFVIIDKEQSSIKIENFAMLISSKIEKLRYKSNILLEKNNENNLNKNSIVKADILYKIYNNQILYKVGHVNLNDINRFRKVLVN